MKQYIPTILELKEKGFEKVIFEVEDNYDENKKHNEIRYRLSGINMEISFNPEEEVYIWYMITTIGDKCNHIHLNLETKEDLDNLIRFLNIKK